MRKNAGAEQAVSTPTVEAVDNALRILLLLREQHELRLTDVSEQLSVAPSTAHRLLATLAHRGFVRQNPANRCYRAGPVLTQIALAASRQLDIRQVALPRMQRLASRLHETINLIVLEGAEVRFIEGAESDQPIRVTTRTGMSLPAHSTSSGKVLLAELPRARVRALFPSGLAAVTERTITTMTELEAELRAVKKAGYAVNLAENEEGLHAVAVPIRDHAGMVLAALVASVPASRLGPKQVPRFVEELRSCAAEITAGLPVDA